jgi:hypothetical protein
VYVTDGEVGIPMAEEAGTPTVPASERVEDEQTQKV